MLYVFTLIRAIFVVLLNLTYDGLDFQRDFLLLVNEIRSPVYASL